jgi:hypothetical protein
LEQEKKIRTRRQLMSSLRFDAAADLKRLTSNEELNALRPIAQAAQTYLDFFEQGYRIMQPMAPAIAALSAYVKGLEESAERLSQNFASSKRAHDNLVLSSLSAGGGATAAAAAAALTSSLQGSSQIGSTGVRDLDAFARKAQGLPTTSATEKEGYLYLPSPNFCPVYVSLSGGKLTLNREALNQPDLTLDVQICTVKENRDAKLRWVFNIISPQETLLLQADSNEASSRTPLGRSSTRGCRAAIMAEHMRMRSRLELRQRQLRAERHRRKVAEERAVQVEVVVVAAVHRPVRCPLLPLPPTSTPPVLPVRPLHPATRVEAEEEAQALGSDRRLLRKVTIRTHRGKVLCSARPRTVLRPVRPCRLCAKWPVTIRALIAALRTPIGFR